MTTLERGADGFGPTKRYFVAVSTPSLCENARSLKRWLKVHYAEALLLLDQAQKAETTYMRALQLRKSFSKQPSQDSDRRIASPPKTSAESSEAEAKFHLAESLIRQSKLSEAIGVLDSIPARQRTAKASMTLALLHKRAGMPKQAADGFREVLRECPLALEAVLELLNLDVDAGVDVSSVMTAVSGGGTSVTGSPGKGRTQGALLPEWLQGWIRAQTARAKGFERSALSDANVRV